ncbi:hypothetical protein BDN72DRAFT_762401, partial [Pluteus cervinus]
MGSEDALIALARRKIDAEVAVLKARIRALGHERNRLAPVSRCPPEVMMQIFLGLQQLYISQLESSEPVPLAWEYRNWITVTHVSQRWRQTALDSKRLWNVIPIIGQRWLTYATTSFKRVGSVPI